MWKTEKECKDYLINTPCVLTMGKVTEDTINELNEVDNLNHHLILSFKTHGEMVAYNKALQFLINASKS